jgi:hypothetical protein
MSNDNEVLGELTERLTAILYPAVIDIELIGNIAILRGNVPSLAKKNEVALAAACIPGIEGIENRLTLSAPERIF